MFRVLGMCVVAPLFKSLLKLWLDISFERPKFKASTHSVVNSQPVGSLYSSGIFDHFMFFLTYYFITFRLLKWCACELVANM